MTNEQRVVSRAEWLDARRKLLAEEKEFTRKRDALSARRRELPWVEVEAEYSFNGPDGKLTLAELFGQSSQLIIYHFMFAPDWEAGCKSCSFWADNFNGVIEHLKQRDVAFAAISRAPLPKLQAFAKRLGWSFPWLSSNENSFNFDYNVSFSEKQLEDKSGSYNYKPEHSGSAELPGISVFLKDDAGKLFHTYSCYSRGLDMMNTAYHYLDLAPKGRDEGGLPYAMAWVRLRDEYGT